MWGTVQFIYSLAVSEQNHAGCIPSTVRSTFIVIGILQVSDKRSSLVRRLFPPQVFDCLQYVNTEGEGLGDLVTWLPQVDRQLTHRGRCSTVIIPVSCWTIPVDMNNKQCWCLANVLTSSPWTNSIRKDFEILRRASFPVCLPFVYLTSWCVTKSPRPSPSIFVYCKQSNTGGGNGLGTRLECRVLITMQHTLIPRLLLSSLLSYTAVSHAPAQRNNTVWSLASLWLPKKVVAILMLHFNAVWVFLTHEQNSLFSEVKLSSLPFTFSGRAENRCHIWILDIRMKISSDTLQALLPAVAHKLGCVFIQIIQPLGCRCLAWDKSQSLLT